MNSLSKELDRLNALLKLVDLPTDDKQSEAIKPIIDLLASIDFKNNKMAKKIVKCYIFKADITQKNSNKTAEIYQLFSNLKKKGCLEGVESCWILDETVDALPNFHRVKPIDNAIPSKMLFHIHANEFGANNQSFEGYRSAAALEHLVSFLRGRKTRGLSLYGLSAKTLDSLHTALDLSKDFTGAHEKITQAFEYKKPLLLPGGWTGAPSGHAMLYEIIPHDEGKATFRLFNLGAGSKAHFQKSVGNKIKTLPYLDFIGVSKATLLDPHVIKALKELQEYVFFPGTQEKTEYDESDIYQGLQTLLKPEKVETHATDASLDSLKTTQYSGICAWRSLLAFLSTKMTEYKLFICDIKLLELINKTSRCQTGCQTEVFSKGEWGLLKKSVQKLSRTLAKAFEKRVIGSQYALYASLKMHKISKTIEQKKDQSFKPNPIKITPKREWWGTSIESCFLNDSRRLLHEQINSKEFAQACSFLFEKVNSESLKELIATAKSAKRSGEYDALNISLIKLLERLDAQSFKDRFKDSPEKAKEAMTDLGALSKIFFESCLYVKEAHLVHPDRRFALAKLLYLLRDLSLIVEPENLKNLSFKLDSERQKFPRNGAIDFYFQLSDAKMHKELHAIESSLTTPAHGFYDHENYLFDNSKELWQSSSLFFEFERGKRVLKGSINYRLRALFPELVKHFNYINEDVCQQNASFYASNLLPDWFKALRDTHLYLLLLMFDCIANPSTPDIDCSLQFRDTTYVNAKAVHFSLKGLSGNLVNQHAEVKKIRERPELRYRGLHRPFQCPKLAKFFDHLQKEHKKNSKYEDDHSKISREKAFFADDVSHHDIGLSDELFKDIKQIFLNKELRIAEAFAFFMKNPARFADPDYQIVFSLAMLGGNECLPFAKKIETFIQTQIDRFLKEGNIQTGVFLLRMHRIFNGKKIEKKLRKLIGKNGFDVEEKSVIYSELIATLSKKNALEKEDLFDLLSGLVFLQENPVPAKWICPQTNKEVEDAAHIHAKSMRDALMIDSKEPNIELLNRLLGKQAESWKVIEAKDQFPYFISGGEPPIIYYPFAGKFLQTDLKVPLPNNIREHPHFKQLFSDVKEGVSRGAHLYEFINSSGHITLLQTQVNQLIIEQKRDNDWYRFIPREAFLARNSLGSQHLSVHFNHWQSLNSKKPEIQIVDGDTCYAIADLSHSSIKNIIRQEDQLLLGKTQKILTHFEEAAFIQEWYQKTKEEQLKKIELPRFGLSFTYDAHQSRLYADQFAEGSYFLCSEQYTPALGAFTNALVLENEAGNKKILIPNQWLTRLSRASDQEALEPKYALDRNVGPERPYQQSYFLFTVKKDGKLESESKKAQLFLSYILCAMQEYAEAAPLLQKHAPKLSRYTKEEELLLLNITLLGEVTGDNSGNGIAARLYASYLLIKNQMNHNCKVTKELKKNIGPLLKAYLSHYENITELKLTPQEEAFLVKFTLNLKHLETTDQQDCKVVTYQNSLGYCYPVKEEKSTFDLTKVLITRINKHYQVHFFDLYEIARTGSDADRGFLKTALDYARHQKDSEWGALLECVLENRELFPSSLEMEKNKHYTWWIGILKIADGFGKETLKKASKVKNEMTAVPDPIEEINKPAPLKIVYGVPKERAFTNNWFNVQSVTEKSEDTLQNWLKDESLNPISQEPLYKKEIERFKEKINYAVDKYELKEGALEKIEKFLSSETTEKRLEELKSDLLEIANCLPQSASENARKKLKIIGGSHKELTLDELFVHFAKNDTVALQLRNPLLDEKSLQILYEKIADYLFLKTEEQQREKALEQLENVKKCADDVDRFQEAVQELAGILLPKREFEIDKHPAYLVFEYYAEILLRKPQVDKLKNLLETGDLNPVMEMIMGSGKSKVLLPLVGLLRADGEVLSTLIVPKHLFESVAHDTQKILWDFKKPLRTLYFDRNTQFSLYTLKGIRDELKSAKVQKECLIMTNKSIQCFLLKFVEKCKESLSKGEFPEELSLMQEILLLLGKGAHPLIDEADSIFNVLHEVSFSLGKKINPAPNEIKLIKEIYAILYTDPEIKALVRFDSQPQPDGTAPVFTEGLYHNSIKPLLAKKLLERLDLPLESIDYLCRNPKAQDFYERQSDEIKNTLALAAEEISNFLPHTLTRKCKEKYGLDENNHGIIAIPFAAANTPNSGSQFANPYITYNYTYQFTMKNGISRKILAHEIERIQSACLIEQQKNPEMNLEETHSWKEFLKIKGLLDLTLFNLKESDLDKIVTEINASPLQKLSFVSEIILPQVTLFSHKASCNAHNLADFYRKLAGFTGTLWNSKSMHTKLQAVKEAGTDLKTIKVLWDNSRDEVYTVQEGSPESLLTQLSDQKLSYDLISDAGGYFKEGGNLAIARQMAKMNGNSVVFYNAHNEQSETNGALETLLADSKTPISARSTFLDQCHTTGADVKQKPNAVGLVTIGGTMLLRDLLQAVWRLRGLEKAQKVKFIVSHEVESIIRQSLKKDQSDALRFDDILRFVTLNQVKQQGKDNFKALRQELASIAQSLLFNLLLNNDFTLNEKAEAFALLEGEWITEASLAPKDLYGIIGCEEKSALVLKQEEEKSNAQIDLIFKKLPFLEQKGIKKATALARVKEICLSHADSLPGEVIVPIRTMDSDQTVEIEQEVQTELEVQEHQEREKIELGFIGKNGEELAQRDEANCVKCKIADMADAILMGTAAPCWPYFEMKDYCQYDKDLKDFSNAFEGICVSANALEWPAKSPSLKNLRLIGAHRTPLHYVQVINGGQELIILSPADAVVDQNERLLWDTPSDLCSVTFGSFSETQSVPTELIEKIAKVKFLSGESSYSKLELELLEKWFNEVGFEKMRALFQGTILAGFPEKAAAYNNSNLRDLFSVS